MKMTGMKNTIFPIFYSEETKAQNDPGFLPMNNLANERPDWREYWPIRNYLLNNILEEDTRYGFFSPKFEAKTTLNANKVNEFIGNDESDVILFSPYFEQSAFNFNVFEQLEAAHGGSLIVAQECLRILRPDVSIYSLIMDSRNTVYCNYFIANKKFWKIWFQYCELIYNIAESNNSELARRLNSAVVHDGGTAPMKVFIIERIASFILTTNKDIKVKIYNPMDLPLGDAVLDNFKNELCVLDAMKISFLSNPLPNYAREFDIRRKKLLDDLKIRIALKN
jgi:hypothetical protein